MSNFILGFVVGFLIALTLKIKFSSISINDKEYKQKEDGTDTNSNGG